MLSGVFAAKHPYRGGPGRWTGQARGMLRCAQHDGAVEVMLVMLSGVFGGKHPYRGGPGRWTGQARGMLRCAQHDGKRRAIPRLRSGLPRRGYFLQSGQPFCGVPTP